MSQFPSVTKFMASKLITFSPDTDIREAIDTMLKKKISGAPVLDKEKRLVGVLSEVDCLRILLDGPYNELPGRMDRVADYMSRSVKTISVDHTIMDAAQEFIHSGYKRLPVVDKGRLVGQISRVDVLRAVQKMEPTLRHIPDSWRNRPPAIADHKKSRYNENA